MTKRYLVGGPSNSGKSTYLLSIVEHLQRSRAVTALTVELDVWSKSYPSFRGEVAFKDRPKKFGLDWDWKTPLDAELKTFNGSDAAVVFGDMPGAKIDAGTDYMCEHASADGAIVVSRTLDGIKDWRAFFERHGVPVVHECLSLQGRSPLILRDMDRSIDAAHPDVASLAGLALGPDDPHADEWARAMEHRFTALFKQNYARRSRTAMGHDDNAAISVMKKPLFLTGDKLKLVAMRNAMRLANDVRETPKPARWTPEFFRTTCERWFDIANDGICSPEWYEEEHAALKADALLASRARGADVRVNPRYRVWTSEHTLLMVPPILLEEEMDRFYVRLADLCAKAEARHPSWNDVIEVMAYADLMIDGELRPWLDGCGRLAVTLTMWIARALGAPLPLFAASQEVHKMSFRNHDRHRLYFLECVKRAEAEVP